MKFKKMQTFAFFLWCPPFIWPMVYKLIVLITFLLLWWHWPILIWGMFAMLLFVGVAFWLSFRRGCRAYVAWANSHPNVFDIPKPFSSLPVAKETKDPFVSDDPLLTSFFLFVFLSRLLTPFIDRRVAALHRWWESEEHDRLVVLLRVTGAFPRIPFYLFLCILSVFGVFVFVPSILDLDLLPLEE